MLFTDTIMHGTCNLHGSSSECLCDPQLLFGISHISVGQLTTRVYRSNGSAFCFLTKFQYLMKIWIYRSLRKKDPDNLQEISFAYSGASITWTQRRCSSRACEIESRNKDYSKPWTQESRQIPNGQAPVSKAKSVPPNTQFLCFPSCSTLDIRRSLVGNSSSCKCVYVIFLYCHNEHNDNWYQKQAQ